jgi:hypothetical protein
MLCQPPLDADGYFVIGGSGVAEADYTVASTYWLQNGPDAVALFYGSDSDFPNDTPVTTTDLIDAIVYDTNDGDDAGILPLINSLFSPYILVIFKNV